MKEQYTVYEVIIDAQSVHVGKVEITPVLRNIYVKTFDTGKAALKFVEANTSSSITDPRLTIQKEYVKA